MERIADGFKGEKAIITPYNVRREQTENEITRQLYVTHIGYYPQARYHFRERTGGTNENILIYCADGAGWIEYKDEKHVLKKHSVFILPANETHAYGADNRNPWSIYWIHFRGENVAAFSSIIARPVVLPESDNSRFGDRLRLFEEMYRNLEMGYSTENLEFVSFCLQYFLASVKYLSQYRITKNVEEADSVQKSILFMKEHLELPVTLKDIAASVGYSISHFGAMFTQKTSYSPMEYLNQLKIQRACSYLQFSDLQLKEIAFRLGFYDPFHFSKTFKQVMEITPREYRKRYKN
ncbi:MAG: AraC family transcriptional regulator [Bacteroidales bacterium]|nr:AraC family transcriptional regulator [Bacteroidales bacterium]